MKLKRKKALPAAAVQLRAGDTAALGALRSYVPLGDGECRLYRSLRESLPIIDAAVGKLVRLVGDFHVECGPLEGELAEFLRTVPCGRAQRGIHSFLAAYTDSLLTYGRAVGEVVLLGREPGALCWGDVTEVHVKEGKSPLDVTLCAPDETGALHPLPYPGLLLFTTLNPEPAHPYGVSLLRSMPFLADILLKIYHTLGSNWERAGNVRYAVVCRPGGNAWENPSGQADAIAKEWGAAMEDARSGLVRDFVAVGDVSVKVIGADGQILDSQVPVRQLLEQLVAKTGLPPFLLGLSWSTTERMSRQQADMLTSELQALRRTLEPALERICTLWLRARGSGAVPRIRWEEISLQDLVEEAQAGFLRARTRETEEKLQKKE